MLIMSSMSKVTFGYVLVCVLAAVDAFNLFGDDCPDTSWQKDEGHCYLLSLRYAIFPKAKSFCESIEGAHLVSITSVAQNTFVRRAANKLCESPFCSERMVWLGLSPASQGSWKWNDERKYEWNFWRTGAPISPEQGRDCVAMDLVDGAWATSECDNTYLTVCTKPIADRKIIYIGIGVGGGVLLLLIIICCCCCCCGKRNRRQRDSGSDIWSDDSSYGQPTPNVKKQGEMAKKGPFGKMRSSRKRQSSCSSQDSKNIKANGKKPENSSVIEMTPLTTIDQPDGPLPSNPYVDHEAHKPVMERVHSIENRL